MRKIVTRDKYFIETIDKIADLTKQMENIQKEVDKQMKPYKDKWNKLNIEHETIKMNRMKAIQEYSDKELGDFEVIVSLGKDKKKGNYYIEVVDEFEDWKKLRAEKIKQFAKDQEKAKKEIRKALEK